MKKFTLVFTSSLIVVGTLLLCSKSSPFIGGFFFAISSLFPLFFSLMIVYKSEQIINIRIQLTGIILYFIWFSFVFLSVFNWNPDPQGPIALLFVGLFSLPIMTIFWTMSLILNKKEKQNKKLE